MTKPNPNKIIKNDIVFPSDLSPLTVKLRATITVVVVVVVVVVTSLSSEIFPILSESQEQEMLLSLVQSIYTSPFQSTIHTIHTNFNNSNACFLPKSLFPSFDANHPSKSLKGFLYLRERSCNTAKGSQPMLLCLRLHFYLQAGFASSTHC